MPRKGGSFMTSYSLANIHRHSLKKNKISKKAKSLKKNRKQTKLPQTQHGGTYLPPSYHGADESKLYSANPAGIADSPVYGKAVARSFGVTNGVSSGPNLFWSGASSMTGGSGKFAGKQRGGTYLPPSYHGTDESKLYSANPAGITDSPVYGKAVARSFGVTNGVSSGPNLFWSGASSMTGGSGKFAGKQRGGNHSKSKSK